MSYELELLINGRVCRGFVSATAGSAEQIFKIIHNHKYAEIHMILDGGANFLIGGKLMKFQDRDAFLIPAGVYHCCRDIGENARDIAFQVAADAGDFAVNRQPETVLGEIAREISVLGVGEGGGRLAALLSYVGSDFFPQPKIFESFSRLPLFLSTILKEALPHVPYWSKSLRFLRTARRSIRRFPAILLPFLSCPS